MPARIAIDMHKVASFCQRWNVAELALFGSVLREDFRPDSDVDVLVSWLPGTRVSMLTIGEMAADLEELLGRPVDLVPKSGLKPLVRAEVLGCAEVVYAA
jgi:predicted nucleotidyltransferase